MSYSSRRRARELERRLAELDRLDAVHGLGAWPPPQRPRRRPDRTGWLAMLIVCVIGLGALVVWPRLTGDGGRSRAEVMAGSTGPHVFLNTNADGTPVRYNPCRPVRYQINPANGPGDAEDLVAEAVEEVSAATGLGFEYAGVTRDRPGYSPGRVIIGWGSEAEFPRLAGRTIGLGGSMMRSNLGGSSYIGGMVVIESDRDFFRDRVGHRAVLMHELGHVVGLDHVEDPGELMARENSGQEWFGPGDIQGLAELGRGTCLGRAVSANPLRTGSTPDCIPSMSRTPPSYPRAELRRARRAWLGSRGRPLLVFALVVVLGVAGTMAVQVSLVGVDVASMLLGMLVGGTAVALLALMGLGHLLADPRAVHHLRGATGEDATRDELRIARRRRQIWGWVDSLPLDRGDIDHLVITRHAGLVAIDSKYRTAVTAEDIVEMASSGRRTATRAEGLVRSLLEREHGSHRAGGQPVEVTPVVVIWGRVGREMPERRVIEGVHFLPGRDLRRWLREHRAHEISAPVARDLERRLIARRDASQSAQQLRVKTRQERV